MKQYPSCFCNHAAILAALELVKLHGVTADSIESGSVVLTPVSARLVGSEFNPGDNPQVAAQFSVQYSVANVLLRGGFELGDIEPDAVRDTAVLKLASRFDVQIDDTQSGKFTPATVQVRSRDGNTCSVTIHSIPGTPQEPLSDAVLIDKARTCFASRPNSLDERHTAKLIDRVTRLEAIRSMAEFWDF